MTKEEKKLLLKDLCGRLPYNFVYCYCNAPFANGKPIVLTPVVISNLINAAEDLVIKPYLRPISSMTEEEVDNLFRILKINEENANEWIKVNDIGIIRLFTEEGKDFYEIAEATDYLHSIHIDYRGLITKGLAIAVTEENNPYK